MMPDNSETGNLILLYTENAKITAIFLDWRHKVMTRWFTVTGATFVGAGWFYQQRELRQWLVTPFLLGLTFSLISLLLDERTVTILQECYRIGGEIERKLSGNTAIFQFLGDTHHKGITYSRVLRVAYLGVALLFLALAIWATRHSSGN